MAISVCVSYQPTTNITMEAQKANYTEEGIKAADEIPRVEDWKTCQESIPLKNGRFIATGTDGKVMITDRVSFLGIALAKSDLRPAAAEIVFRQNPDDPDEYGVLWLYRDSPTDVAWKPFAKCWGLRRVDGRIDRLNRGDTRSADRLQFAILRLDGQWEVSPSGTDLLVVEGAWIDETRKDVLIGFDYAFGFLGKNGRGEFRDGGVRFKTEKE